MIWASAILVLATIPVLALATFVQLLYLESLRLRTRDLPSLKFFKDTLEDKLGLDTEHGAGAFSLIKHTLLALLGVFCYGAFGNVWEAAITAWLIMIVFTYALPQLLYRRTEARWLVGLAPLLRAMALIARPCQAALDFFQSLIDLTDVQAQNEEPPTPAENIEALITAGEEEGLIEKDDRALIQSVVEFGDKVVREVMTARPDIVGISANATLEDLRQLVVKEQFSRIPVYEQSIDQIIGFVHVRDMFEIEEDERERRFVRELVRNMPVVPETKPVGDLMRQMQAENTHMVAVVDEYGNTAGIATLEDLLEEIIGEIRDEHEPDSDVKEDGKGGYIVSGNFDLGRVADLLHSFKPEDEVQSNTIGGLLSEWLGRVPRTGESVERDGVRVDVLAAGELRVEQVRISKAAEVAHG